ncbi:MAG: AAA family ATPase [Spirochaetaceae bacterium]|nr:AAA family ATPase [Spirochaetaceae bacterium]
MRIDQVQVKGLFGRFDHHLKFATDENIMIMIGPNGFGKTTTLRLIDALFNRSVGRVAEVPFRQVEVTFDNGCALTAVKAEDVDQRKPDSPDVTLTLLSGRRSETFEHRRVSSDSLGVPISAIEDAIPALRRVGRREWHNLETGRVLDLEEVLAFHEDELAFFVRSGVSAVPEWLQELRNSVAVRFIDTERLTSAPNPRRNRRGVRADTPKRTVSQYSHKLATQVGQSREEYVARSQSLERTFPARVVADNGAQNGSMDELRSQLNDLERKRSRLEHAGLLAGEQFDIEVPELTRVDESHRKLLTVFAQDAAEKLAVFDKLYDCVDAFTSIANSRLRHKQVVVSAKGLGVADSDGDSLDLEKLSSGEQHELVILYELIFRTAPDSLVLIDEPELSLHVAWQAQFVPDLERMTKLTGFRAILATHSPDIIGDRWDLTVELHEPGTG